VSDVLAAALVHADRVLGTLLLWREQGAPPFRETEQAYVAALAGRLAVALAYESRPVRVTSSSRADSLSS
jgi:hypothetical protein